MALEFLRIDRAGLLDLWSLMIPVNIETKFFVDTAATIAASTNAATAGTIAIVAWSDVVVATTDIITATAVVRTDSSEANFDKSFESSVMNDFRSITWN